MTDQFSDTISKWKTQARNTKVPLDGPLKAEDLDFHSGSQFTTREFLHLHVLRHKQRVVQLRRNHQDILPSSTVDQVVELLGADPNIVAMKSMLSPAKFKSWNNEKIAATTQFAVGLEFLHSLVESGDKQPTPDGTENMIKIRSPRKTRFMGKYRTAEELRHGVSKLNLNAETSGRSSGIFDASLIESTILSSASTESMVDEEMEKIRENYERQIFEAIDEQTVNACLVALIMPVTWILGFHQKVHLDRQAFRVQDSADGNYLYETRVDGIISDRNGVIVGFLEVKRGLRRTRRDVRMQESAQMAAAIHNDTEPLAGGEELKKWMISMGGREGHITIAKYGNDYVKYLKGESDGAQAFMTMQEYGPFDLRYYKSLKAFLENIGALMQRSDAQEPQE